MKFSQYRGTVCKTKCCVANCNSTMKSNLNLGFHKVPKSGASEIARKNLFGNLEKIDKRAEWLRKLNIPNDTRDVIICSRHFRENDYYFPDVRASKRVLRKNAVPVSVTLTEQRESFKLKREERLAQRQLRKSNMDSHKKCRKKKINETLQESSKNTESDLNICKSNTEQENQTEPEKHDNGCEEYEQDLNKMHCENEISPNSENFSSVSMHTDNMSQNESNKENSTVDKVNSTDKCIQVNSECFSFSFSSFIKTEKNLITMCNIQSFKILDELTKLINEIYPPERKRILSTRDCIICTTAKLKLDISFSALAVFYHPVTDRTIRKIFYDTVRKLARILKSVISRVPKEEIQRNMPECFNKFQATTSVFDCTEIKMQKPKCLKCRIKFYSHYKGDLTVKFMTEVTPAGLITFVSEPFGGRASDKCIFNHSGVLHHLESTRDAVMVDRGFLIDEECMQRQIALIRPPFMKNRQQLTEQEAVENREIAGARVHIERMNERIKEFKILNNKYPWHMIDYIEDIFIICCGVANLGTPILADDKF